MIQLIRSLLVITSLFLFPDLSLVLLQGIRAKVKELNDRVVDLEESLMKATEDKNNAIAQAEKTAKKAGLADRLINGLSGENKRWNEEIKKFEVNPSNPPPFD